MTDSITVHPSHVERFREHCRRGGKPYLVWNGHAVKVFVTDKWRALCYAGAFLITSRDDLIASCPEALGLPDESLAVALTDITNDHLVEQADAPAE